MKNEHKVSIVVPVYNAEKTLHRCLFSLINQEYINLEIIIINDGSTDKSYEIINDFSNKYSNVKSFWIENQGVSNARNLGIEKATGKYIQFVDSDDYVSKNYSKLLVESLTLNNCDLSISGYATFSESTKYIKRENLEKEKIDVSYLIANPEKFINSSYLNVLWNKLFILEVIKEKNITFPTNINLGEDLIFNLKYLSSIESICILNKNLYFYRIENKSSLSGKFSMNFDVNQMILYKELERFFLDNKYTTTNTQLALNKYFHVCWSYVINHYLHSNLTLKEKKEKTKSIMRIKYFRDTLNENMILDRNLKIKYFLLKYKLAIPYIILFNFKTKKN